MSDWKILGQTVEEFVIRWNAVTFELGGLPNKIARKLSEVLVSELKETLNSKGLTLTNFFANLTRGGSLSAKDAAEARTELQIKEFYRFNFWGTSIPYTLPIVLDMSPEISGKNILDVGCGFGRLSLLCALKGANHVTAVDLSEPLIQSLERTVHSLKISNIETHLMDAENLNFEKFQYDIIYCCEVIEHLPNPVKALQIMYKLLKPTGKLILSTPNVLNIVGFKYNLLKRFRYNWISPYGAGQPELHMFTPMSLRALLARCGFNISVIRGAELLDNLAILYPGAIATGLIQFLPLLFPAFQKIKNGLVRLAKTRFFYRFGLEMFVLVTHSKRI